MIGSNHVTRANNINAIDNNDANIIFKKILYLALMESISTLIYGKKPGQASHNFSKTIEKFSQWKNSTRYSTVSLHKYLELNTNKNLEPLRSYVSEKHYKWHDVFTNSIEQMQWINKVNNTDQESLSLCNDLSGFVVENIIEKDINGYKSGKVKFYEHKHSYLLYNLRSFLVHSLIEPGFKLRSERGDQPYYEAYFSCDPWTMKEERFFDLYYPVLFLKKLAEEIVDESELYFQEKRVDPMSILRDTGLYFLEDLNRDLGQGQFIIDQKKNGFY